MTSRHVRSPVCVNQSAAGSSLWTRVHSELGPQRLLSVSPIKTDGTIGLASGAAPRVERLACLVAVPLRDEQTPACCGFRVSSHGKRPRKG